MHELHVPSTRSHWRHGLWRSRKTKVSNRPIISTQAFSLVLSPRQHSSTYTSGPNTCLQSTGRCTAIHQHIYVSLFIATTEPFKANVLFVVAMYSTSCMASSESLEDAVLATPPRPFPARTTAPTISTPHEPSSTLPLSCSYSEHGPPTVFSLS